MTGTRPRVTMMLCDYAQVAGGKLFISGGGWSITGVPAQPSCIAVLLHVPWTEANRKIRIRLQLITADGQPVTQPPDEDSAASVVVDGELEVGRPIGLPEGTFLEAPLAVNIPALLMPPGRYVWELWIDGVNDPDWQLSFLVRAQG